MNQRDILRRGEDQRNTEPDPRPVEVICAKATGCLTALDGCPYEVWGDWQRDEAEPRCPATGEPVEWRES
jgi:hypothetical protein